MEGVLGFTGDMCRRIRQKMDVYANDVFYLGIQAKWLVCRLARGNGKPYYIPRTAQLVAIPYYMTRLTALPIPISI